MDLPTVCVVTITKNRPREMLRCVESVQMQSYRGRVIHVILGDESAALRDQDSELRKLPDVEVRHLNTSEFLDSFDDLYVPSRLAFLRNLAIDSCESDYICYLDDDNYMEPSHIEALISAVPSSSNTHIIYSWRKLCWADGEPYLDQSYPWTPEPRLARSRLELSRYIYSELVAGGIAQPGSNVVKDAVVDSRGLPVYTVDTNEMLYSRAVHRRYPNIVRYSWREMVGDFSDDFALIRRWHLDGLGFVATGEPTVTYTIGGVSNGWL